MCFSGIWKQIYVSKNFQIRQKKPSSQHKNGESVLSINTYFQVVFSVHFQVVASDETNYRISYRSLLRKKSMAVYGPELWDCFSDVIRFSVSLLIYTKRLVELRKYT